MSPVPTQADEDATSQVEGVRAREGTRVRPPTRTHPLLQYDVNEQTYAPWEGVHPSRLLETVVDLLRRTDEAAVARYVRDRIGQMETALRGERRGLDESGDAANVTLDVPGSRGTLVFAAHLDAETPPVNPRLVGGGLFRKLEGGGAGLHGRGGVAVLLEALEVLCEARARSASVSGRAVRAVFCTDGDGQMRGAHRVTVDASSVSAAFSLDGFLADEVLLPRFSVGRTATFARTARREAEQALAQLPPQPLPREESQHAAARMVEHTLARGGMPAWFGWMAPEATAASVFAERGVSSVVLGTGVTGTGSGDETFSLTDAVLSARLLVALTDAPSV